MRGDVVYRVYGRHAGREKDYFFGAFRTRAEAEAKVAHLMTWQMHGRNWAEHYHDRGFVVREATVETDFEVPTWPKPRDRYFVRGTRRSNGPGVIESTVVEVFRRGGEPVKVAEYERNYGLLQTFEPFRHGDREFALVSRYYHLTEVLDLRTGEVVAAEPDVGGGGFCPVGFYVPDWWDVHDGSILPGSEHWSADREWPTGDFGFVWGCVWGDDSSWKVQYLDLSGVRDGVVRREERFGYVELATTGYRSPCLEPTAPAGDTAPPPFVAVSRWAGETQVTFAVEMRFDLGTGEPEDWRRTRAADLE